MKKLFTLIVLGFFILPATAQKTELSVSKADTTKKIQTVDAACGQCQFKMTGKGCD